MALDTLEKAHEQPAQSPVPDIVREERGKMRRALDTAVVLSDELPDVTQDIMKITASTGETAGIVLGGTAGTAWRALKGLKKGWNGTSASSSKAA